MSIRVGFIYLELTFVFSGKPIAGTEKQSTSLRALRRIRRATAPPYVPRTYRPRRLPIASVTPPKFKNSIAPTIESLAARLDVFLLTINVFKASKEADVAKFAKEKAELIEAHSKRIQVLETRLNETRGHSVHAENAKPIPNFAGKFPEALVTTDLKIFKGSEAPLTHIKTFKNQMIVKGVLAEQWPYMFPLSLSPFPATWFYGWNSKGEVPWEEITIAFVNQYQDNVETQVSTRTLEVLV